MAIRVSIHHKTEYRFDRSVNVAPHLIRLRPAPHTRTPIHHYSLKVEPEEHFLNWVQDPFGNYVARYVFPEKTRRLSIDVNVIADLVTINPFDFFVEEYAEHFPFEYDDVLNKELLPFREITEDSDRFKLFIEKTSHKAIAEAGVEEIENPRPRTILFLVAMNRLVHEAIGYTIRMEPGIQSCDETLDKATGSCRDSGWLLVQMLRHLGLAARFVSGYLVQLAPDQESLDGPSGPDRDITDLHAWTEVFVPGAGWLGLDPTSGLFAGEGHIPLCCTADPSSASPIEGATDKCEVSFSFENEVSRFHEDPRVTLPYNAQQWARINRLGEKVDDIMNRGDIRLTMGGEPTFVSIDDMDSPQWNTEALGNDKRKRADSLFLRLRDVYDRHAVLMYGQGKWYPGEQLPRWALTCAWLRDGRAIWRHPELFDRPDSDSSFTDEHAGRLANRICTHLELDRGLIQNAFEDIPYYLWKEGTLPPNVDVADSRLDDPMERARIRRVFDNGLDRIAGFALPLAFDEKLKGWRSSKWRFRRERLYLIPGDSPMGYRLPLDSLLWEPEKKRQELIHKDPFEAEVPLPELRDRLHVIRDEAFHPWHEPIIEQSLEEDEPAQDEEDEAPLVRTSLCVEQRNGHLHVFLPPVDSLEHFIDLVNAIEAAAMETNTRVILEGYEPPWDSRLTRFQITPDPGVIEVNIHPSDSWQALCSNTEVLYAQARLARLGTEKFMLDGRHSGTGGGNHITVGSKRPEDSPFLRRPHLLRSLLTYWQNHPSLSFLFSGLFIGPTSQAPRVDEARDESLYELEIAFSEMQAGDTPSPWLVDRLLRNLLVDITGNTHRAEFCIDKLYSPGAASGRLGLVEFRGFEMPPHAQMSLVQALLLRILIARFWDHPYEQDLVRWGTELHDRFMLPHYVEADIRDVISDINRAGYKFELQWLNPFMEFRFPVYGRQNLDDIELELRFAIEPWHVLGEEITAQGTARYVDSSVERMQVKLSGITRERHAVLCNGRRIPIRNTGTRGEYVGGVRYKAWHPPSGLHPTIVSQAPLTVEVIDTWSQLSLGGCTYHVAHPGGRNYETFPVNAGEAEARRLARFIPFGHQHGIVETPAAYINPDFPLTLDLRRKPQE